MADIMMLMIVLARDGSRLISIAQVSEQASCGRETRVLILASETRRFAAVELGWGAGGIVFVVPLANKDS